MYKKPYVVVGTGRSGTSMVAGMMNYLGFYMGVNLVPANRNNPAGHFEDNTFKQLNLSFLKDYISEEEFIEKIETRINMRATEHRFWGWKVPSTALVLDKYFQVTEPKVIWCKRPKRDVINSMKKSYGWSDEQSEYLYNERTKSIKKALKGKDYLELQFKDIIDNPKKVVKKLIDFSGIKPYKEQEERAIQHIIKDKPKKGDDTKILVALHNGGSIRKEVIYKALQMTTDGRYRVTIILPQAKPYTKNVNHTIQNVFLKGDFDFLLIVDADNPPIRNPLDLIELNKDILGLPTPQWSGDIIYPVAMDKVWSNQFKSLPPERHFGLQEIDATGSGCVLIARRVIEAVDEDDEGPVWNDIWDDTGTTRVTADYNFCDRAKKLGYKVWTHFDYPCDHIKEISLDDMLNYANKKPRGGDSKYWG